MRLHSGKFQIERFPENHIRSALFDPVMPSAVRKKSPKSSQDYSFARQRLADFLPTALHTALQDTAPLEKKDYHVITLAFRLIPSTTA